MYSLLNQFSFFRYEEEKKMDEKLMLREEALKRMKYLGLSEGCIDAFKNIGEASRFPASGRNHHKELLPQI